MVKKIEEIKREIHSAKVHLENLESIIRREFPDEEFPYELISIHIRAALEKLCKNIIDDDVEE